MIFTASLMWGSIPTWALFALGIFVAWRLSKGGGGSAVSELSKANEVLTRRVHELGAEVRDLKIENAELKARTDVSLVVEPMAQRIIDATRTALLDHERAAIERHQSQLDAASRQLVVLDMIANRLGPDGNGERRAA